MTVKKHLRAQEIAARTAALHLLVDSGGAHLPHQTVVSDRDTRRIFFNQASFRPGIAHRRGHGLCHCRGAYVPAMSTKRSSARQGLFVLGGPPW